MSGPHSAGASPQGPSPQEQRFPRTAGEATLGSESGQESRAVEAAPALSEQHPVLLEAAAGGEIGPVEAWGRST